MALVLVRKDFGDVVITWPLGESEAKARAHVGDVEILEESAYSHGRPKRATRTRKDSGRPVKPKTSVAAEVAKKAAPKKDADTDSTPEEE